MTEQCPCCSRWLPALGPAIHRWVVCHVDGQGLPCRVRPRHHDADQWRWSNLARLDLGG